MKSITSIIAALALVLILAVSVSFAQEKMTMEEYNAQLAEWQKREADAKAPIAQLAAELEVCGQEAAKVDGEIESLWQEIYTLLGTDEASVNEFGSNLDAINSKLDGLSSLSPEELFKSRKEIDELEQQLAGYKESNIAMLSAMQDKIATIEGKIAQLRASMPKGMYDDYTVIRGDYLWKISGKADIYNDPYQWMRIYSYNTDQIGDPDVIEPGWILKIHRESGANEYLVVKGDWLSKIASNPGVYGDPTEWTKIFEANKDFIKNKNVIYPYQVLQIPD
jgi:nucleoid-associated protein YgaU